MATRECPNAALIGYNIMGLHRYQNYSCKKQCSFHAGQWCWRLLTCLPMLALLLSGLLCAPLLVISLPIWQLALGGIELGHSRTAQQLTGEPRFNTDQKQKVATVVVGRQFCICGRPVRRTIDNQTTEMTDVIDVP